jgi:hypothetical protein
MGCSSACILKNAFRIVLFAAATTFLACGIAVLVASNQYLNDPIVSVLRLVAEMGSGFAVPLYPVAIVLGCYLILLALAGYAVVLLGDCGPCRSCWFCLFISLDLSVLVLASVLLAYIVQFNEWVADQVLLMGTGDHAPLAWWEWHLKFVLPGEDDAQGLVNWVASCAPELERIASSTFTYACANSASEFTTTAKAINAECFGAEHPVNTSSASYYVSCYTDPRMNTTAPLSPLGGSLATAQGLLCQCSAEIGGAWSGDGLLSELWKLLPRPQDVVAFLVVLSAVALLVSLVLCCWRQTRRGDGSQASGSSISRWSSQRQAKQRRAARIDPHSCSPLNGVELADPTRDGRAHDGLVNGTDSEVDAQSRWAALQASASMGSGGTGVAAAPAPPPDFTFERAAMSGRQSGAWQRANNMRV